MAPKHKSLLVLLTIVLAVLVWTLMSLGGSRTHERASSDVAHNGRAYGERKLEPLPLDRGEAQRDTEPPVVEAEVPKALGNDPSPPEPTDVVEPNLGEPGAVHGRVLDLDNRPVADALLRVERKRGQRVADGAGSLPETSGEPSGLFRFDALAPGTYRVEARAPGYGRSWSEFFWVGPRDVVELDPIRLKLGHALVGTVLAADGTPLAGATVEVLPHSPDSGRERVETDAAGAFRIEHLTTQKVGVRALADGFARSELRDVDLRFETSVLLRLQHGATLRGLVVEAQNGTPVERFGVRLRRLGELPDQLADDREIAQLRAKAHAAHERWSNDGSAETLAAYEALERELETTLDDRISREVERQKNEGRSPSGAGLPDFETREGLGGTFRFDGLDAGVYAVDVVSPVHRPTSSRPIEIRSGSGERQLTLQLEPGLRICGTVSSGGTAVVARVELRLQHHAGSSGKLQATVSTDEGGRFCFAHAAPGSYVLAARAQGYETLWSEPFELSSQREDFALELTGRASLYGVVGRSAPNTDEVYVVVVDREGAARNARVQPDGSYLLTDLAPGGYSVHAVAGPLRAVLASSLSSAAGQSPAVRLSSGERRRFDLDLTHLASGAITGTVRCNGDSGAGMWIELHALRDTSFSDQLRTDHAGKYRFTSVPTGQYELRLRSGSGALQELTRRTVFVDAGAELVHDFDVQTARLQATVASAKVDRTHLDGRLLLFAGVSARPPEGSVPTYALTVRDGRLGDTEIKSGAYFAVLNLGDRVAAERPVSLVERRNLLEFEAEP